MAEHCNSSIPFNRPYHTAKGLEYIAQARDAEHLSGDGVFTHRCQNWLQAVSGARRAFLTHSCTSALEMAAVLTGIGPGDEVIMPSFTFVSTANAFVLRGAIPVFVDICETTLNLDPARIEAAITDRTRAIVPVHYGGVGCDMAAIMAIATRHNLWVIEDAAQGMLAWRDTHHLGTVGHLGALSFHQTKNVSSGEGGALLVNDPDLISRAEIIWDKGTNRKQFLRGEVDKYCWEDVGSSYLPGEMVAAYLLAQLEASEPVQADRISAWNGYHQRFLALENTAVLRRPVIPDDARHNAHLYYLLMPNRQRRDAMLAALKADDIGAAFHYVPLHSAPAGKRYAREGGSLAMTESVSERLLRLPMWAGLSDAQLDRVVAHFTP